MIFHFFIVDPSNQEIVYEIAADFMIEHGVNVIILSENEFALVKPDLDVYDITDITVGELGKE